MLESELKFLKNFMLIYIFDIVKFMINLNPRD